MFPPRFAALVESGTKRQTVCAPPKRMPRPGDFLAAGAWTGAPYRSKQRQLGRYQIRAVQLVKITAGAIIVGAVGQHGGELVDVEAFAIAEGFADFADLVACYESHGALPFTGVVIGWDI